jgi:ATP-binding cassette subfamily B multidrug efflux pump
MQTLTRYLKPYWKAVLLAPLLMIGEVFFDLMQPRILADIVDNGVMTGDLGHIQKMGALMLVFALLGAVTGIGCGIFATYASMNFGKDIRLDLFSKVQNSSFRNLEKWTTGSLITRLTADVVQLQNFVQMLLRMMVRSPFTVLGSMIMAFMISVKLTLILIVAVPILLLVIVYIVKIGMPLFVRVQAALDGLNSVIRENLAGIRVVKAFVRADFEKQRFGRANEAYRDSSIKANLIMATMMPIMLFVLNIVIVLVLAYGGKLHSVGGLQVGELVAFINYVTQLLFNLMMLSMIFVNVTRARASADRVVEVLVDVSEIRESQAALAIPEAEREGRISFDHVYFAYDEEKYVLKGINFTAEPGQTIAILGSTGAGKSTLVSLIPRLYEAKLGRVLIDGVDVRDMRLHELRSRIGFVMQEAVLFSGTIRDNIRYGRSEASQEQVETAAKAAEAHNFIMDFPDGYDTIVGQKGVNLSGGQKQRLSIARALLIEPEILILDDSTSAIDLGTESRIQLALKQQLKQATSLVIAQRVSSVMEADNILVLDEGEIVASGTHEELLGSSPVYQDICRSQLRGEDEASA